MKNIRNIDESWDKFLQEIENYANHTVSHDSFYSIISDGLKAFYQFPNAVVCAVYLTNNNFEFEYKGKFPEKSFVNFEDIFENELNKGTLGFVVENTKTIVSDTYKYDHSNSLLIVPLSASNVTLGVVFLLVNQKNEEIPKISIKLTSLLGSLFANSIENSYNIKEKEVSNILLEQKIAQRTSDLENSKRELNAILDSIHNAIIVVDNNDLNIIKTNYIAEDLLQATAEDLYKNKITDYLDCDDIGEDFKNYESTLITKDKNIPILRTTSFLKYGNQNYRIESFFDITEIKEAERKLQEANELLELKVEERTTDLQLLVNKLTQEIKERENAEREIRKMLAKEKELNELKSRFVAMVSHEFRTPLTVIKSSTQLIHRYFDRMEKPDKEYYLYRIEKTVDILTQLIDNALFVSKSEKKTVDIDNNEIHISDFLKEIISDIKLVYSSDRNIQLFVNVEDNNVETDAKLLRLIVTNLINNALKYSDSKDPIDVSVSDNENDKLEVSVKDYGIGIPESEQNKIFDLFYRASNVGNIAGTGLGMVVVIESLKLLNGKLDLSSEVNKGSVFKFIIPKKVHNGN